MKRIWAVLSVASFAGQGDAVRATPFASPSPTAAPVMPTPTPTPTPAPKPIGKQSAKKPPAKLKQGKRAKLAKRTRQGAKLKWKTTTKKVCVVKKTTLRTKRKGTCVVRAKAPAVGGIKAFSKKYRITVK